MTEQQRPTLAPGAAVGFIGLGQMGFPMAGHLRSAGYQVRGYDLTEAARSAFAAASGAVAQTASEAALGVAALITMLPNETAVRNVLLGPGGIADALPRGALVIDMSSSAPQATRDLGRELAAKGLDLIDAPVSGGVKMAIAGALSIMAGGSESDIERARPILSAMGKTIFVTGPLGCGHAMKALNNYVSAAGLVAAVEALMIGRDFGLSPDMITDVLNASTGRNNTTDRKLKQFIISETFASGFSMALMAKDLRAAAELASQLGVRAPNVATTAALWEAASATLGVSADHTEIGRYLETLAPPGKGA